MVVVNFVAVGYAQEALKKVFPTCGVEGSTTIYDYKNKKWLYSDAVDAKMAMQPASTFKLYFCFEKFNSFEDELSLTPTYRKNDRVNRRGV